MCAYIVLAYLFVEIIDSTLEYVYRGCCASCTSANYCSLRCTYLATINTGALHRCP